MRSLSHESGYLTEETAEDLAGVALAYLEEQRQLFGLTAADLDTFEATAELRTERHGPTQVWVEQRDGDRPVFENRLVFAFDADGRLVGVNGTYQPGVGTGPDDPELSAEEAVEAAAASVDAAPREPLVQRGRDDGVRRFANSIARGVDDPDDITAELVMFPMPDGRDRLAWRVDMLVDDVGWYQMIVDASDGEVLYRTNRFHGDGPQGTAFTGQHPDDSPPRAVVPFTGVSGSWVGGTETVGNNVDAYEDRDQDNGPDAGSRPSDDDQHFDYAFADAWRDGAATDPAGVDVDTDRLATVTQMFYYVNVLHDFTYGLGFTEEFGNFQENNFGRGGEDGDPVNAEARDGYGTGTEQLCTDNSGNPILCRNNAFFGTPADGSRPRMQMYMWDGSRPFRDGALDGDVIAHEYGHGVSSRLVGGQDASYGPGLQAGALNEGWSDVMSFMLWDDPVVGDYVTGNATTGIRTVAYDNSAHVFGDFPASQSTHRNGEIWATTLWDVLEALRERYGQDTGLDRFRQLVIDGMKNTSEPPTFLDARDGLLTADQATNGGSDRCLIWARFADREMGVDATATQSSAEPDETVPAECRPTADAGGPYQTEEGVDVALDASESVPGFHASVGGLSYAWDLDNDGQFDDATGVTPVFDRVGQDGTYPVAVRVTNGAGLSADASAEVIVDNVGPSVSLAADDPVDEGSVLTVEGVVTDPGWLEELSGTVDWGDGSAVEELSGTLENDRPDATLSYTATHVYADNGTYSVMVCGADDDTETCESTDVQVHNVAPTVTVDPDQVTQIDEGGTVHVTATFEDPGFADTFTAELDWGTTEGEEASAPEVEITDAGGPGVTRKGTVTASYTYGDNDDGAGFDVTVTVTDDDGGAGVDGFVLDVGNVAPTAELDLSGAGPADTILGEAGEPVDVPARSTDPGSDDLTLTWAWGDGSPDHVVVDLVNPPDGDPLPSPSVQPRDVTASAEHVYADACMYEVGFAATDDDGGASAADTAAVAITGNAHRNHTPLYWWNQYGGLLGLLRGFDKATLDCYLEITQHFSTVFSEERDVSAHRKAKDALTPPLLFPSANDKLDAELLAVWLNVANGAVEFDHLVDTDCDGAGDTTVLEAITAAEAVRLDPDASRKETLAQRDVMQSINLHDSLLVGPVIKLLKCLLS